MAKHAAKTKGTETETPEPPSSIRKRPPAHVIREIAVKAKRHPRTVERFVDGKKVQPIVAAAIREAILELGLEVA